MRRLLIVLLSLIAAFVPITAMAADGQTTPEGVTVRVNGDYHLAAGDTVRTLVVVRGDAVIDGTVTDRLIVVNGDATVKGNVDGRAVMVRGTLTLVAGSTVNDVSLIRGHINEQPGSVRNGELTRTSLLWFRAFGIVAIVLMTIGMGVALLIGGAGFATFGGAQLNNAAGLMTAKPGQSIAAAAIVAFGLPFLTVISLVTVIGIPVAMAMAFLVGPALICLGLIVAGSWLGAMIVRREGTRKDHPVGETLLGLLLMLVVFVIPGVGGPAFFLLGLWGTGALVYGVWSAATHAGPKASPAASPAPPAITGGVQPT